MSNGEVPQKPVSIHAPARGATETGRYNGKYQISFNPRARAGRDEVFGEFRGYQAGFNPRARAGRDTIEEFTSLQWKRFNPRARAGRDLKTVSMQPVDAVSIHAPARGATVTKK